VGHFEEAKLPKPDKTPVLAAHAL